MKWLRKITSREPSIVGIDHVAIIVSDMDRAIEFYTGVLGLKLMQDGRQGGGEKKSFLGTESGVLIALAEDKTRSGAAERGQEGVHHIAFGVHDVDKMSGVLKEKGVEFIEEKKGEDGVVTAYHFLDPEGIELEICSITKGEVPKY